MEEFDVAIIGAGPAGLVAARRLAEKGKSVLCLDKKMEIGAPKRCAEGLGGGWFERLGIETSPLFCRAPMMGACLYTPSGKKLEIRFEKVGGYIIERKMFEKELARIASKKGAKILTKILVKDAVREKGKVKLKAVSFGEEKEFLVKAVICAEGMEPVISRKLGVKATNKLIDVDSGFQYEMSNIEFENPDLINLFFGNEVAPRGYCLTGDSEIIAKNTVKPISSVEVGEDVLTLDGWMPVSAVSEREFAGEIVSITPFMANKRVRLTPDHLVWVWNKKEGFRWEKAGNLKKGVRGGHAQGDYLVFPLPEKKKYLKEINVTEYFKGITKKGKVFPVGMNQFGAIFKYKHGIPIKLQLSKELLEFFGYYVSEGSSNSSGIIIANTDEKIIKRVSKLGEKLFGFKPSFWVQTKNRPKKCVQVQFGSKILKKLFESLFGVGCKNKHFPKFFFDLSEKQKISFLTGLFRGDGSKEKSSENLGILSYISTSDTLIYDLWLLLTSINVVGAIGKNKKKNALRIRIRGKQLKKLNKLLGHCKHGNWPRNRGFFWKGDRLLLGIRELKTEFFKGKVYDIESGGSFCPFFAVHNCWIFPKGKDIANVGIGIGGTNQKTAKEYLDKFIASHPGLKKGSIVEVNAGIIPVGGFLDDMTADNVIAVGDTAHQVDPMHGGGMGIAMEAAEIAAKVINQALDKGDVSRQALQPYNKEWYETRGNKLKARLKWRLILEKLSDDHFEELAASVTGEEILKMIDGDINIKLFAAKKLVKHPGLVKVLLGSLK